AEFARPGSRSALTLLDRHPRLVVTRTMSKAFGFAGGRLGYLAAHPGVVDALRLVRLPYHLSRLAQAAARAVLAHAGEVLAAAARICAERDLVAGGGGGWGPRGAGGASNFALCGGVGAVRGAWRGWAARGVLARAVGVPGGLRVTAGTPEETAAFVCALAQVIGAGA